MHGQTRLWASMGWMICLCGLALLTGCPFEGGALEGRRCTEDLQCDVEATGFLCIGGFCQQAPPQCQVDADCPAPTSGEGCSVAVCSQSLRCVVEPLPTGTACGPEGLCAVGACDAAGSCQVQVQDSACDDGVFCNGAELCAPEASGADTRGCLPGVPVAVDDGVACTEDRCDEAQRQVTHDNSACSCEGDQDCVGVCQIGACLEGLCQFSPQPTGEPCDDGVACTLEDQCDGAGACRGVAQDSACGDDAFCNGAETCQPGAPEAAEDGCVPGEAPTVDDGIACTEDRCDEQLDRVVHDDSSCACGQDSDCVGVCREGACVNGSCQFTLAAPGTACDDGVDCTEDDFCDAQGACGGALSDRVCDNGLFCDGREVCAPGRPGADARGCAVGTAPVVDDGVACTVDLCDEDSQEVSHDSSACACQRDDDCLAPCQQGACVDFACVFTPAEAGTACDDGVACTVEDRCDEAQRCLGQASDAICADEDLCNGAESCNPAQPGADARGCIPGQPTALEDGVDCTQDSCDPLTGLVTHTPVGCQCTVDEDCAAVCRVGRCEDFACAFTDLPAGSPCEDGVACTVGDRCDEAQSCLPGEPSAQACADEGLCNGEEICAPGELGADERGCVAGTPLVDTVTDERECVVATCDEEQGLQVDISACCGDQTTEGGYGDPACRDGLDNDCDEVADEEDPDCAFSPTALEGLVLWLDASDLNSFNNGSVSDGDRVSTWSDKSGGGNHATQNGNARPLLRFNGLNERAVVEFDGADDVLVVANESRFDFQTQMTAVVVASSDQFDTDWQALLTKGDNTWRIQRQQGTDRMSFSTTTSANDNNMPMTSAWPQQTFQRILVDYNSGTKRLFLDNTLNATGTHGSALRRDNRAVWLGSNAERTGRGWDGHVAEVLVFSRVLTEQERLDLDAWLVRRWGL